MTICGSLTQTGIENGNQDGVVQGFRDNVPPPTSVTKKQDVSGTWTVTAEWPPCASGVVATLTSNNAVANVTASQDQISSLVALASDPGKLQDAQHTAAQKLLGFDGEVYPSDGCAITLSVLMQQVGLQVPDVFQAISLGQFLMDSQQWMVINVGDQKPGDVGSTCGVQPDHGQDHIYLVLQSLNSDEMIIADNQSTQPHFRFASGKGGKTPTKFFLRAPG